MEQLSPGSPQHNVYAAYSLAGPLDPHLLERCLNEIVWRYDILRANFQVVDGRPVQAVDPSLSVSLPLSDLSGLPAPEKEVEVRRLAKEEAQRPFDLSRGPLVRAGLLRLGEQEHVLLLTAHEIVFDEWSMRTLFQELSVIYEALTDEEIPPLPTPPIQYADYAAQQQEWLRSEAASAQLAYWKRQLGGSLPPLDLPADRPRPPMQTYRGARQSLLLPSHTADALKTLSEHEGVDLFVALLAAFKVLLYRYTGQNDIVVGAPITGRTRPEIEGAIGPFANTLALRTMLDGNLSFRDLLRRTQEVVSEAHANQDMPFEKLVEELQPERDLSRTPLFAVTFALEDSSPDLGLPGLTATPLDVDPETSKYDLSLSVVDGEGGLACRLEYSTDLFDATTIARILGQFQTLLDSIVADSDRTISQLLMLAQEERQQLLVEWNDTETATPIPWQCIHELVERQVERTPGAVAASFKGEEWTYQQLNSRANKLAHHLRELGVGPEVPVGVCMERSLHRVAALLGVLKAGGAYVPLDPAYPQDRLAFMLADSQAPVLLTQQGLAGQLPEHGATVVYLDEWWEDAGKDEGNLASGVRPDNLAYILYTSGSTGRPKGVSIEHKSAIALIEWATQLYTPDELSRVLASTSISFDLSVFELFVTLSCGGMVVLVENALHLPSLAPGEYVTLINTVPSAIAELLRTDGVPASVRVVNLAGEPLQQTIVQQLYERVPGCRVFNLYGPTEDTTYSTFALMEKGSARLPHIGRPISNSQVYLLDRHMQPVPVGVRGELYMGGAGLARGYLKRPDLTAERFVPNPFARGEGRGARGEAITNSGRERLYKTGDLAAYLPDGNIQFLGRLDHQVKLRGFRIELGEIEAVLRQ
ncbi:MAG TPA: amino acid adenylation domain-containing protein, partial [Chloroflexia bacterium]|nr:amino acid adenylation domain-containing protein [Chloroflexia bacterium]